MKSSFSVFTIYVSLWKVSHMTHVGNPRQAVSASNWEFTRSMYKTIATSASSFDDILFCPLSVQVILALCSMGAGGETAKQMLTGLHLPNQPAIVKIGFKRLLKKLANSGQVNLETGNIIFPAVRFPVLKSFIKVIREFFLADVENIDYEDPVKAAELINTWVETATHQKISGVVSESSLSTTTSMVLVNAVYFKGMWETEFEKDRTTNGTFYADGKEEISVDMMLSTSAFAIKEVKEIGSLVLELPYKDKSTSFVIILPLNRDGLPSVEEKLSKTDLRGVLELPKTRTHLRLLMPKFSLQLSTNLDEQLIAMGLVDMFKVSAANFSGMTREKGLVVSSVMHKAMLEVSEEGTEAAATTAVEIEGRVIDSPSHTLIVEHPFAFALVARGAGVVLFMGRYTGDGAGKMDGVLKSRDATVVSGQGRSWLHLFAGSWIWSGLMIFILFSNRY